MSAELTDEQVERAMIRLNGSVTVKAGWRVYRAAMREAISEALATPPPEGEPEEQLVCIWSGEWNQWWRPNSAGYTPDWREAGVYPISKARKILAGVGDEKKLEIVNHTPDAPYTPEQPSYCPRCTQEMDRYSVTHCLSCDISVGGPPPSQQAHGDALAAMQRLEWPADYEGREADIRTVLQALTASGVPEDNND